jgi:23S rRNA (adenine2503-C2)-methyltransferase
MILLDMDVDELKKEMGNLNEPPFRAVQLRKWLAEGAVFDEMSNLPASLRDKLKASFSEGYAKKEKMLTAPDGTKKYLLSLSDGNTVESVFMVNNYGNSVCLSTQVGCKMGCSFCESCKNGFVRNLSSGEILSQYIAMNRSEGEGRNVSNIVLMGMGEPLDNYDNVIRFLKAVHDKDTFGISYRNISVSTCGLVPEMLRLSEAGLPVTLCVSLHAPFDEKRMQILPIANKWSVEQVIGAAKTYFEKTKRRFIIEYALIDGFNDTKEDAERLRELLLGTACHVNLIPLNPTSDCDMKAPSKRQIYAFCALLEKMGLSATVRRSLGSEILGACGQLKNSAIGKG